ncbi:unnamed protein product, partial [Mesorhabditis belari]|uniref:Uncharacterized protein n=1 Tax=Mesorhabditis belari TaxID=2138241 RepID=A0AAF3FLN5_9BILA
MEASMEFVDGRQWNVEYFNSDPNITVNVTDKKHTVYIFQCEGCTVRINGKCNSVTLDQCKKTAVVFDGIVAQVETINCESIQLQTLGELPTVSIQKTDGCQIYLSEASVGAEIVTSKSSEMNLLVPGGPDGDFIELPIPEQFKTVCNTPRRYSVTLDVHEFNPSDLKVQTKGRKIVVEGKHLEAENRFGSVTKFFKRKFKLPKECELSSVESRLSPQGILCIETKKRERKDSQNVPIVRDFADPFVVEEHF